MRVDFYSDVKVRLDSRELVGGDWIVLLAGGHGIELLEPSVLIEVKNGPYAGEEDKIRFKPNQTGRKPNAARESTATQRARGRSCSLNASKPAGFHLTAPI